MNCSDWEERIALYAGGDLPPAEAAGVERHLGECAGCQMLLGGLRESLELLREGREEPVDAAHFAAVRARVLSELERGSSPWWRRAWVYATVAVAAAVLVLAVSVRPKPATQAVLPPATPQAESKLAASVEPGVGTAGTSAHAASTPVHRRRRRTRKPVPTEIAGNEKQAGEPLVVKVITDDPEVIIYWITDTKGE